MNLRWFHLCTLLLGLSACQDRDAPDQRAFDQLAARVSNLEQSVSRLQDSAASQPKSVSQAVERPSQSAPSRARYRLVGTAFQNEPDLRYQTREECETAKATLLEDWRLADERSRAVFTSRPTPSCLPI